MQIKKMASINSRTGRQYQRYNKDGCRLVVGCIPYRLKTSESSSQELEVLLISSQKSSRMMFPKGGWENDEEMEEAALRETIEEAGVDGIVEHKLGTWSFESSIQGKCNEGHMFSLRVTRELDAWPEQNTRRRTWMSIDEASRVCAHSWMKAALEVLASQPLHLHRTDDENQALDFLPKKKDDETRGLCQDEETPCSLHIVMQRKEEDTQMSCIVEFFRTESPIHHIVLHSGEEDVDCCIVS